MLEHLVALRRPQYRKARCCAAALHNDAPTPASYSPHKRKKPLSPTWIFISEMPKVPVVSCDGTCTNAHPIECCKAERCTRPACNRQPCPLDDLSNEMCPRDILKEASAGNAIRLVTWRAQIAQDMVRMDVCNHSESKDGVT